MWSAKVLYSQELAPDVNTTIAEQKQRVAAAPAPQPTPTPAGAAERPVRSGWTTGALFRSTVAKALAKNPDARYASAVEMQTDLELALEQAPYKFDIYLAHAPGDGALAAQLHEQLGAQLRGGSAAGGADGERLTVCIAGADFNEAAARNLCRSRCFVPVLSPRVLSRLAEQASGGATAARTASTDLLLLQVQLALCLAAAAPPAAGAAQPAGVAPLSPPPPPLQIVPVLVGDDGGGGGAMRALVAPPELPTDLCKSNTRALSKLKACCASVRAGALAAAPTDVSCSAVVERLLNSCHGIRLWELPARNPLMAGANGEPQRAQAVEECVAQLLAFYRHPGVAAGHRDDVTWGPGQPQTAMPSGDSELTKIFVKNGAKYRVGQSYTLRSRGGCIFGTVVDITGPSAEQIQKFRQADMLLPPSAANLSVRTAPAQATHPPEPAPERGGSWDSASTPVEPVLRRVQSDDDVVARSTPAAAAAEAPRAAEHANANALNAPGHWDVMISYTQRNMKAKLLASELFNSLTKEG
eukprot:COSAG01_NODE_2873_length_6937_cov_8.150921_7_plen_526_part_01